MCEELRALFGQLTHAQSPIISRVWH